MVQPAAVAAAVAASAAQPATSVLVVLAAVAVAAVPLVTLTGQVLVTGSSRLREARAARMLTRPGLRQVQKAS